MNAISIEDVLKLARLSALSLDENETVAMQHDLTEILGYVEQLQQVDTDGIEPTYQVHGLETITRTDEVVDYGIDQAGLLSNAPEKSDAAIVVPRVLE